MKVSIIGTNGFLSIAIAKYCNMELWALDMYGLNKPQGHDYDNFYKVNLLADELEYIELIKSDIIIYASGAGIQHNLHEGSSLIYSLNVTIPVTICNKLKANDYKGIFVSFGSVFEIGQTIEHRLFTEEDIETSSCKAPNDYTISKRMLTRFISSYKHTFTHWHFIIPTIYGEGENSLRLIPYTINSIRKGYPLKFTSGEQIRQYIYVNEVPKLIHLSYIKALQDGIYNIGGNEVLSVKEIVFLIHRIKNKEMPHDCFGIIERVDADMQYLALDSSKLYNAIGFNSSIKMSDIISKY